MKKKPNRTYELCSLCDHQTAELAKQSQIVGRGENQVIVENVPVYRCRRCGGEFYTRDVAVALDEIHRNPKALSYRKTFAAASLELV